MKIFKTKHLALASTVLVATSFYIPPTFSQPTPAVKNAPSTAYTWKQVPIGPFGFVPGMSFSPVKPFYKYARTDVGGVYRYDDKTKTWIQLVDKLARDDDNYAGIEAVAADPKVGSRVYIAAGDIYRSDNAGKTWTALGLRKPDGSLLYMGSNDDWRNVGERLAVDPNGGGKVLYFGSRRDGLWRTTDSGKSWKSVESFPVAGLENAGIGFVLFDSTSGTATKNSQTIYAGVVGEGVFVSRNGGETWTLLAQEPDADYHPLRGAIDPNGVLYVTYMTGKRWAEPGKGAIYRYVNGKAENVSPTDGVFCGIDIHPSDPKTLIVSRWSWPSQPSDAVLLSRDSGKTWKKTAQNVEYPSWWISYSAQVWNACALFDRGPSRRAWFSNGVNTWSSPLDASGEYSQWKPDGDGIEELVGIHLLKAKGKENPLLYSAGDKIGFTLSDFTRYPNSKWAIGEHGNGNGLDFCASQPSFIVASYVVMVSPRRGALVFSKDSGRTWQPFPSQPDSGSYHGAVAVSASQPDNVVVLPEGTNRSPYFTRDGGKTWAKASGTAPTAFFHNGTFTYTVPLAADRQQGGTFYCYSIDNGRFWRSEDGGETWTKTSENVLPWNWRCVVKAVPDRAGEVWAVFNEKNAGSLWRSLDGGETWSRIAKLDEVVSFDFGHAAPGQKRPTVFLYGKVDGGGRGMYRSDDLTQTNGDGVQAKWVKIDSDTSVVTGPSIDGVAGDPDVYGKVYVSVGGRGVVYGERSTTSQ